MLDSWERDDHGIPGIVHCESLLRKNSWFFQGRSNNNHGVGHYIQQFAYAGLTEGEDSTHSVSSMELDATSNMLSARSDNVRDWASWSSKSLELVIEDWKRATPLWKSLASSTCNFHNLSLSSRTRTTECRHLSLNFKREPSSLFQLYSSKSCFCWAICLGQGCPVQLLDCTPLPCIV